MQKNQTFLMILLVEISGFICYNCYRNKELAKKA